MSSEPRSSLISQIPAWTLKRVAKKRVIETGFATGPGYCAGEVAQHHPPISCEQGLAWLERYRGNLKGASVVFEDRSIVWFRWDKYERYQLRPANELPRPGLELSDRTDPRTLRANGLNRRGNKIIARSDNGEPCVVRRPE